MIFSPYADEADVIKKIQKIRNGDYVLLRLTPTMIEKNNLDANELLREMLYKYQIVDYDSVEHGGNNGVEFRSQMIHSNRVDSMKLKFYRVNNIRGDRRFSIETIKKRFHEGDLLYISAYTKQDGKPEIFVINLTREVPSEELIQATVGYDLITQKFIEIRPLLAEIVHGGFYNNSKGRGPAAPKDVGDTLESLLKISTNNSTRADISGLIELKAKEAKTLDTLFTLRPNFEGTEVAQYEANDRNRVSAFARLYGYESEKHPGCKSLYITVGSADYPQNGQGFYLEVDEINAKVSLMRMDSQTGKREETAYWTFENLKKQLMEKHPATLWIKAVKRVQDGIVQFKYTNIEFSRTPQFMTFLSLIKTGIITYDWRGYTSKKGKYTGKNHGNAWRIKPAARAELFGELETIEFDTDTKILDNYSSLHF